MIKVRLAAAKQWQEIEYRQGTRVRDILEELKYHPASIASVILNGTSVGEDVELKDGDELVLVPTVGGGTFYLR
ncbi:MAG: MoaD/ThiS family protein [Candidatus Hadarchaeaceae archaeon]